MVFTLSLSGVRGEIPAGEYFIDWRRTANDGRTERGRAPASLTEPLVIRTSLDRPGFVKIEANLIDKTGKFVPKKHLWEKRVFFQGGAGVEVDKLQAWPEPKDFDAHWTKEKALVDGLPLKVTERKPLPCANPAVNLWQVKIPIVEGYLPMTGYLVIPKNASVTNRMKATGHLSGYYMWKEDCPSFLTNCVDGIQMYINRHGCEGDREEAYYKSFLKNPPYGADHFRGMALRGLMMFRYLKSLPEWDGKTLESKGSSGGAMQSLWMAALVPELTRIDIGAPALGDVFGFKYGRETGNLGVREEAINYYDICNFAKRITIPVSISAGLGDYTCPPFGIAIVYNNLRGPKRIEWKQGTTHGWWPGGMAVVKFSDKGGAELEANVGAEHLVAGKGNGGDVLRVKEESSGRTMMLGDSITHFGYCQYYLQLFENLRHPGSNVRYYNAGYSGATVGAGRDRLRVELDRIRPDRAFVMFGMNDVHWWEYDTTTVLSAERRAAADKALEIYEKDYPALIDRLLAAGVKDVTLVTPTPYDEYSTVLGPRKRFVNEYGLQSAADIVRRLASERGLKVVDLGATLTGVCRAHPEKKICGADGIHPGKTGYLLMASAYWRTFGDDTPVAVVSLDASGTVIRSEKAMVSNVATTKDALSFDYKALALPFPDSPEYRELRAIDDDFVRFNRELLIVTGLATGDWELVAGGRSLGTFSSDALSRGVNLAELDTPNRRQSTKALEAMYALRDFDRERRDAASVRPVFERFGVDLTNKAELKKRIDAYVAKRAAEKNPCSEWDKICYAKFLSEVGREKEITAEQDRLYAAVAAPRPERFHLELKRVKGNVDIGKYDRRMVQEFASVVSNGVKWIDGRELPLEGKAFADVESYYDRLPKDMTKAVNEGVRIKKHETAGLQFRFKTDSRKLRMTWKPTWTTLGYPHFCANGASGIDIYRRSPGGTWRYVKTGSVKDAASGGSVELNWDPSDECLINLPLYNGLRDFRLGVDAAATICPAAPHLNGGGCPVVFYGTSITQGASASRPGLSFVNIVGRQLDVPVVNLGFSGSGHMELEMSEHLAKIDAACYVLDCLWNMDERMIASNYETFIRNLRRLRPDTPLVLAAPCDAFGDGGPWQMDRREVQAKAIYDRLVAEGWEKVFWIPRDEQLCFDGESTTDTCHPGDYGMMQLARTFGKYVSAALTTRMRPPRKGVMSPARPMTDADFATLKKWNVSLLRYQMTEDFFRQGEMKGGDPAYRKWLDGKLDHLLDFVLPMARKNGIRVVVDLHVPPGGRVASSMDWAIYSDAVSLERFFDAWRHIAERLRGNADVIYGYDLLNEPVQEHPATAMGYLEVYERAAGIVRAIDPLTPIIVESLDWDAPESFAQLRPVAVPNVIYEVHLYRPQEFTHQGTGSGKTAAATWPDASKGWNRDYLLERLTAVREFEKRYGARIYIGEFSATSFCRGADRYLADCISIFDEYGWDWTYHAFREWGAWSVEHEPSTGVGVVTDQFSFSEDNARKRVLLKALSDRTNGK